MPRKELKIDRCMEYGQSRLIDWDHVAEVKGPTGKPPRWPTAASGLGRQRYGNVATQLDQRTWLPGVPCVMRHAVAFSASPVGDCRPTRCCGV